MKRSLIGLLGTLALILLVVAPAGAQESEHKRHHHDATVVEPGESIQAAVDAAAPGTTILVKDGTYAENVVITTDGIRLKAHGAKLVPPATPTTNACSPEEPATDGICAIGKLEFPPDQPPTVTEPVSDVSVKGFVVEGFEGNGVVFLGARDPVVKRVVARDNGEYGIARFFSSGGKIVGNWASGSAEAGIYVGDSPEANVGIIRNATVDNGLFGIFLRDAAHGRVIANRSSGNCVGAIVLNTGANIAGDWFFAGNKVKDNDRFCPPGEEEGTPPLSGIGIAIANGHGNRLLGNVIKDNQPSGEVPFSGGVVVLDAGTPGAEPPAGNVVKGNVVLGNQPDLFWDGSGEGNLFKRNRCQTSVPDGLCEPFGHKGHHGHQGHPGEKGDHGRKGHHGHRGHRGGRGHHGHRGHRGGKGHHGHRGHRGGRGHHGHRGHRGGRGHHGHRGHRGGKGHHGHRGHRGGRGHHGHRGHHGGKGHHGHDDDHGGRHRGDDDRSDDDHGGHGHHGDDDHDDDHDDGDRLY